MGTILDYPIRLDSIDPIPPQPDRSRLPDNEQTMWTYHELYQRIRLQGFSIEELRLYGCFGIENAKHSNLGTSGIHPLYQPMNWIASGFEPIGHGFQGVWDVWGDSRISSVVLPCLYLATKLLNLAIQQSTWYDAMLFGKWQREPQPVPSDGCPNTEEAYNLSSFRDADTNDFFWSNRLGERISASTICKPGGPGVILHIGTGIRDGGAYSVSGCHGGARWGTDSDGKRTYRGGEILLASEIIIPLLQDDLTPSERLAQQFFVANVLVHETMHATIHAATIYDRPPRPLIDPLQGKAAEPFYNQEAINEAGHSWEVSFYGGSVVVQCYRKTEIVHQPILGIVLSNWPNFAEFGTGKFNVQLKNGMRFRFHDQFGPGAKRRLFPIPSKHLEDLQQSDFWDVDVMRFGIRAMEPPLVVGKEVTKNAPPFKWDGSTWRHFDYPTTSYPDPIEKWMEARRQAIRAVGVQDAIRRNEIWREMDRLQARQQVLQYLTRAVSNNQVDILEETLNRVRILQMTNEKTDDYLALLRTSYITHIRIQAFFLSSRLNDVATRQQRLDWAAYSLMEARIEAQSIGPIDWPTFISEAEFEVALIQQEIAVNGP